MSWRAGLSRHLSVLRFFACTESPSSKGLIKWYENNYTTLKSLNPTLPLLLRTTENAMPAVTTELRFTVEDVLRYMIQTGKFVNANRTIAQDRVEAAKAYLKTDWALLRRERWASPGFDPEHPFVEKENPDWRSDSQIMSALKLYLEHRDNMEDQLDVIKSGPNDEYTRAENSLLMCQRVDLWCAGEKEVESAVQHLFSLGRRFNDVETDIPEYIDEFYPGAADI